MQEPINRASLSAYLGAAKWIQGVIVLWPLGAGLFPSKPVYCAPPLGQLSDLVSLSFLVVAIFGIFPWYIRTRTSTIVSGALATLTCIVCLFIYAINVGETVVRLEGFNPHGISHVSIGTQRSEFANTYFMGKSNIEMLKEFGHREEDIQQLWTARSILWARMILLFSYIGFFAAMSFAVGAFAKASLLQKEHFRSWDSQ
jgi:hypothetical protein